MKLKDFLTFLVIVVIIGILIYFLPHINKLVDNLTQKKVDIVETTNEDKSTTKYTCKLENSYSSKYDADINKTVVFYYYSDGTIKNIDYKEEYKLKSQEKYNSFKQMFMDKNYAADISESGFFYDNSLTYVIHLNTEYSKIKEEIYDFNFPDNYNKMQDYLKNSEYKCS